MQAAYFYKRPTQFNGKNKTTKQTNKKKKTEKPKTKQADQISE